MSTVQKPSFGLHGRADSAAGTTSKPKTAPKPDPHEDGVAHETSPLARATYLAAVIGPFGGLIVAIAYLWGYGFDWVSLALLAVMYLLTGFGITVGYHRYFTHKSFDTIWPVKFALAVLGSMAVQGPLIHWVAVHRSHHQHSDGDHDPHSPHHGGGGFMGMLRGIWHAHVGWLFKDDHVNLKRYAPDLLRDRMIRWVSTLFPVWVLLSLLIPALIGGLLTWSWIGALLGFIWGGLVRVFLVHHVTWSINSVCHIWGSRPFRTHDESRNNVVFGVLGLGEGWHNNHHAFPASARHGLSWWQIDTSYVLIRGLEMLGMAWNVKRPTPQLLQSKRAGAAQV